MAFYFQGRVKGSAKPMSVALLIGAWEWTFPTDSVIGAAFYLVLTLTNVIATAFTLRAMRPFWKPSEEEEDWIYYWRIILAPTYTLGTSTGAIAYLSGAEVPNPATLGEYFIFTVGTIICAIWALEYKAREKKAAEKDAAENESSE